MTPSGSRKRNQKARKQAAKDLAERSAKSKANAGFLQISDEQEKALDRTLRKTTVGGILSVHAVKQITSVVQGGLPGHGKKR